MMKQFDARRPEFSPYGFTCELWTPARMPRPDRHNEIELNLLMAGSLTYLLGGQRTTIEAGKAGNLLGGDSPSDRGLRRGDAVLRRDLAAERVSASGHRM